MSPIVQHSGQQQIVSVHSATLKYVPPTLQAPSGRFTQDNCSVNIWIIHMLKSFFFFSPDLLNFK